MRVSFRTVNPTGKYRSFEKAYHIIKANGKCVGQISENLRIQLTIEKLDILGDGNKNCLWRWITIPNKFESLEEAKEFVLKNIENIHNKFKLHELD